MPQKYIVKIIEKKNFSGDYWWIKLERPEGFDYQAGQYVSILIDPESQQRRSYSLASYPLDETGKLTEGLELLVDTAPMGLGSKFILGLKEGDKIEILGPLGEFVVRPTNESKVYLATGCGIVPLRAMINDLLKLKKFTGRVNLHWGVRYEELAFWKTEFEELAKKYPNFDFDLVLSKPNPTWTGCTGHLQDCLAKHEQEPGTWEAYICGNNEMIEDVVKKLVEKGIKAEKIYRERFS